MKNNRVKLILWVLVIIFVSFTYIAFAQTLALFEDNASAIIDNNIGKWVIKINNSTISSGTSQDIVVNNFVYEQVSSVENNFIAPGSEAYFDLVLDATECEVAVRYDITFLTLFFFTLLLL